MPKTDKVEKIKTNIVRIMSKPHANLHPIYNTHAKIQKYGDKTVGGVELTNYILNVYEIPKN